jgi:putative ABC transport system permease protein
MVSQRRHEIGVRVAIGARRLDVAGLILRDGAAPTIAGIVLGLLGAMWTASLVRHQLFGVSASNPRVYALAAAALIFAAAAAALAPAVRAARLNPIAALNGD